jgi:hypothetical protein
VEVVDIMALQEERGDKRDPASVVCASVVRAAHRQVVLAPRCPCPPNICHTSNAPHSGDKKPFLRTWLCITSGGDTSLLTADKYKLTAQLGIQTRDLRLLDPNMSSTYPRCEALGASLRIGPERT